MNPDLAHLHPYPFEKLAHLKAGCTPPSDLAHIALSIGEPKHPTSGFITEAVIEHLHGLSSYPTTIGTIELRHTIATWLDKRFQLSGNIDATTQILPVNGTREALFAFAQAIIDHTASAPIVVMPNPFYQIYMDITQSQCHIFGYRSQLVLIVSKSALFFRYSLMFNGKQAF